MKIKELKQELKQYATQIRVEGILFKDCQRGTKQWGEFYGMERKRFPASYRHMHIAYCLLRGRTYEQIENKVREGNEPDWTIIEVIMREYREVELISDGDCAV